MKIEQKTLLQSWRTELMILFQAHYVRSIAIRRLNYLLGVPCILITMLVASYIFFTITHNPDFWVKMMAGMLLLLGAILASLQTFLKYSEQAENHRNASARYQSLHHSIDQLLAFPPDREAELAAWCDKLRDRWDELNLEAPNVNKDEGNPPSSYTSQAPIRYAEQPSVKMENATAAEPTPEKTAKQTKTDKEE
ncbi:SLATT domain-containing protein [Methylomarinum sp. Ch1-1]|uniref:SLATT domain-containing protein n=1 Tax=Methylomarinum roseum TaxID=3067653 RepID=A0AAU7NUV0_9GAMM|nr:SLATT domain-containing protein [Methylomarinum sp. Ch1-1]MDP4519170.1 SLATT domain-containing protein [Methylomarinum sp. Ch1-1]